MENRWWVNDVRTARVDPEEFSDPGSHLCLQPEDPNITFQTSSRSKKRSIGDDNDRNATKADEERPGEGVAVVTPTPRGRRKGSKNKSKAPPLPEKPKTLNTLENRVFEIPSGVDVRMVLETFALKSKMGVFILSGSGTVANVTLMHHAAPGGMVSYAGPLEILSLSGVFHPVIGAARIIVILADRQGIIVAGRVVGSLVASDLVTVITGVAADIPYERLNVNPLEVQPLGFFKSSMISPPEQLINTVNNQQSESKLDVY